MLRHSNFPFLDVICVVMKSYVKFSLFGLNYLLERDSMTSVSHAKDAGCAAAIRLEKPCAGCRYVAR